MRITSPVNRVGGRFVKTVSNKLIQDYWREEMQNYPDIKKWVPLGKAMNLKKRCESRSN